MNPLAAPVPSSEVFGPDPWWIVLVKVVLLFVVLLVWTIFNVWYERRLVAKMQHRLGPIMNPTWAGGLGQAVGDGGKLMFKEDFRPEHADKVVFNLAPMLTGIAAFTSWSVIPFGGEVTLFGHRTHLQLTDMPVAVLFILASASIGVYGIVLAGWSSNSTYSLLGGLRSSAQMISYEVAMGLALVGVFMFAGSMSTSQIVSAQAQPIHLWGHNTHLPGWYALLLFPSFVIYAISMVGETNRAPFDLPECESELVSGYITEYSGFRYALYFLAEYINMVTVSAVATTLFLGGYHAPWPLNNVHLLDNGWFGIVWFLLKVQLLFSGFVWLRGTLPRFRYDQFMDLGWKVLIPTAMVWLVVVATLKEAHARGWVHGTVAWVGIAVALIALAAILLWTPREREIELPPEEFDAFAGGYPVPPMPGQSLLAPATVVGSTVGTDAGSATGVAATSTALDLRTDERTRVMPASPAVDDRTPSQDGPSGGASVADWVRHRPRQAAVSGRHDDTGDHDTGDHETDRG